MERIYLKNLENWLNNPKRKPLIVWGARQVGKTTLIQKIFAEKYFPDRYIYIDCFKEREFTNYCNHHFKVEEVLNYLELFTGKKIDENVLLIFDEAQECLPIITLLKYFYQERKEIPVIVTGSMVRMKLQRQGKESSLNEAFLFPVGMINQMTIYPLGFEEYLMNRNQPLYQTITQSFQDKQPLHQEIHQLAMNVFFEYVLIGGMPEAVQRYLDTNSFVETRLVIQDLYDNYLSDMQLYQASPESIVRTQNVFESIYSQLNKENKNFKYSYVEKDARNRTMQAPIDWLTQVHLVQKSSLIKEIVTTPFLASSDSLYRLYLADIGMFAYQSKINATSFIDESVRNTLSGIFFENYVANELTRYGKPLFYWRGKNDAELEFLVEHNSRIIPIDVKRKRGSFHSLHRYLEHNTMEYAIKVSQNCYGFDPKAKILTIPFYAFFLVCKQWQQETL